MGTNIRADISEKSKYYIPKHRYYELKHFCMQYPGWKKLYADISKNSYHSEYLIKERKTKSQDWLVERCAIIRAYLSDRINMIESAARLADESLAEYIIEGVTLGIPYDILRLRKNIPCGKGTYYEIYRKFFYILDELRK